MNMCVDKTRKLLGKPSKKAECQTWAFGWTSSDLPSLLEPRYQVKKNTVLNYGVTHKKVHPFFRILYPNHKIITLKEMYIINKYLKTMIEFVWKELLHLIKLSSVKNMHP